MVIENKYIYIVVDYDSFKGYGCWSIIFRIKSCIGFYIHSHGIRLRHLMFTSKSNGYTVPLYFLSSYINRDQAA